MSPDRRRQWGHPLLSSESPVLGSYSSAGVPTSPGEEGWELEHSSLHLGTAVTGNSLQDHSRKQLLQRLPPGHFHPGSFPPPLPFLLQGAALLGVSGNGLHGNPRYTACCRGSPPIIPRPLATLCTWSGYGLTLLPPTSWVTFKTRFSGKTRLMISSLEDRVEDEIKGHNT